MKRMAMRVAVFTSVCGGALVAVAHAASAKLATNHCEPIVSAD
jgi:hypothetical protein